MSEEARFLHGVGSALTLPPLAGWLPAFPDAHTWQHTPLMEATGRDVSQQRLDEIDKRRKAEQAVVSLTRMEAEAAAAAAQQAPWGSHAQRVDFSLADFVPTSAAGGGHAAGQEAAGTSGRGNPSAEQEPLAVSADTCVASSLLAPSHHLACPPSPFPIGMERGESQPRPCGSHSTGRGRGAVQLQATASGRGLQSSGPVRVPGCQGGDGGCRGAQG